MMQHQEIIDGLNALGFAGGFAVGGDPAEIILWENEAEQPTAAAIAQAAPAGALAREHATAQQARQAAYQTTADPLFFGWQRGENTEQEWLDAVQAVKDQHPYPETI